MLYYYQPKIFPVGKQCRCCCVEDEHCDLTLVWTDLCPYTVTSLKHHWLNLGRQNVADNRKKRYVGQFVQIR